jgi:type IV pilus assembly protein PilB
MPPIACTNPKSREVQVPKLLLRNAHWVDNLCQCEGFPVDPPGNQRFRTNRRLRANTGEICLSGWVTCSSKKRSSPTEQLEQATKLQKESHSRLGSALVKLGFLSDEDVTNFLSRQYGVPAINLSYFEIDPAVVKLIPYETAKRYQILPLSRVGASLTIAMVDPTNVFAMDDIKFMTGFNIEPVVASESSIIEGIDKAYGTSKEEELEQVMQSMNEAGDTDVEVQAEEAELELKELEKAADEAPIVKLVNLVLTDAVKRGASDIHMEPYEKEFRVRFRIDGVLQLIMNAAAEIEGRHHLAPEDHGEAGHQRKAAAAGRPHHAEDEIGGKKKQLDFRVSTLPTLWGEKIVMRLLDKENLRLDMTKLGFEQESLTKFEKAILKPYGMVLVTGPTGSGKTNTLYSSISQLNQVDTNIMTAEDPVEFQLGGVNQVQMKEQIGLNFAAALRAFLRQDPNIILVGEIRDFETAEIAIKAALTGHLVLSTLHTNGAPETITRLMNMGIEPFLVATSVHLICAQRLIRRICKDCAEPVEMPVQALIDEGFTPEEAKTVQIMKGKGCTTCNKTGYKGRTGLYEVMEVDDEIRELVLVGASALELKKKAIERGMITLRRSGLTKVAQGWTTLEEVARETIH